MTNSPQDGPPVSNAETTDSTPPGAQPAAGGRSEFSLIRVLATVLIVGGLAGGAFLFLTQENQPPALVEFSGQVFYKDKPLPTGGIFTEPFEPGLIGAVGALDAEGRFTLMTNGVPGAYVGRHRLAVSALGAGNPPAPIVPEHYVQPRTSPLIIDVSADPAKNTCKLVLVDTEATKPSPEP